MNASTSRGSKWRPRWARSSASASSSVHGSLYGRAGHQRVEDVADGADAAGRAGSPRPPGRPGSRCRPSARGGCGRSARRAAAAATTDPARIDGADRRVALHDRALLVVEAPRLEQDRGRGSPILPTSCSARWRGGASRPRSARQADAPRPARSTERPIRSTCAPVSSSRHSAARPSRWTISSCVLAQLARALAHALLQHVVVARDPCRRVARLGEWLTAISRPCRRRAPPAAGRPRATTPASNATCARDRERRRAERRPPQRGRHDRDAGAGRARRARADASRTSRRAAGASRSGSAVHRRPDRVRLDLGSGHRLRAADRRRVDVLEAGRRGADDDDAAADERRVDPPPPQRRRRTTRSGSCRAARGSRSARRRRRTRRGPGGRPPSGPPPADRDGRPPSAYGTRSMIAAGAVGQVAGGRARACAARDVRVAAEDVRRARGRRTPWWPAPRSPARRDGVVQRARPRAAWSAR